MEQLFERVNLLTDSDFAIVAFGCIILSGWVFSSFCRLIGVLVRGQPQK